MKRRWLRAVSLLLACLLVLSGCGGKDVTDSSAASASDSAASVFGGTSAGTAAADDSAAETPVRSGSTTFSMPYNESYGWDPFDCNGMENRAVMQLIYEGLFTMNAEFEPEPALCDSWEVSDDGYTWTLHIRDACFSNGDTVDAKDVVYSMKKAERSTVYENRFRHISSYKATADDTVTVTLSSLDDHLPNLLDFPIVPSRSTSKNWTGTGPFIMNANNTLTVNSYWWGGAENLQFQKVTLYSSISAEDTRDSFEIDAVHLVYVDPSATSAAQYHSDYELWNVGGTVMEYMCFNCSAGIFQDQSVRAAVTKAVDRVSIAEEVYSNYAIAAELPLNPASAMYDEDLAADYDYDAKQALSELLNSSSFSLPEDSPLLDEDVNLNVDVDSDALTAAAAKEEEEEEELDESFQDQAREEADRILPTYDPTDPDYTQNYLDALEDYYDVFTEAYNRIKQEYADSHPDPVTYNNITIIVASGNTGRVAAARMAAAYLNTVGFTATVSVLDADNFLYTIYNEPDAWDIYYADVSLTPDFDISSLVCSSGTLNYGNQHSSDTNVDSLYSASMENSGNRYDFYQYILDQGYICPVLFENNAVFTTRGVLSGLNPAPGNIFYQISNITVN